MNRSAVGSLALAAFAVVAVIWSGVRLWFMSDITVYEENGVLENMQALILVLCAGLFACKAPSSPGRLMLVPLFLCWLSVSFVFREVDVEDLAVPQWLIALGSGKGRNTLLAVTLFPMLVIAWRSRSWYWALIRRFFRTQAGKTLLLAAAMTFIGRLFEEARMLVHYAWFEEAAETIAYGLMAAAAWQLLFLFSSGQYPVPESSAAPVE